MVAVRKLWLAVLPALLLVAACNESATEPDPSDALIMLDTTGGFAGVDHAVLIDGPASEVRGERCVSFCDWEDGDLLARVTPEAVRELERKFDEIDFLEGEDEDFGDECCDQFHYELEFKRRGESRTIEGSSEKLPPSILALIRDIEEWIAEEREDDEDDDLEDDGDDAFDDEDDTDDGRDDGDSDG